MTVVGKPVDRIDGKLKTTGPPTTPTNTTTPRPTPPTAVILGSAIAKGRIDSFDLALARRAPGVLAVVNLSERRKARKGRGAHRQAAGGPAGPALRPGGGHRRRGHLRTGAGTRPSWSRSATRRQRAPTTSPPPGATATAPAANEFSGPADTAVGDFAGAFASAPVKLEQTYTTPDQCQRHDGAACDDRGLDRRQADAVDLQPDDRLGGPRPERDPADVPARTST